MDDNGAIFTGIIFIAIILALIAVGFTCRARGAPSEYDIRQDERLTHYRESDAELERVAEGRLSKVEERLLYLMGLVGAFVSGLVVPRLYKHFWPVVLIALMLGLSGCDLSRDCHAGGCNTLPCRVDYDCHNHGCAYCNYDDSRCR